MPSSITLRTHLLGELSDLVESARLGGVGKSSIVCQLVSLLADYREEGAALFLDVFLTNDLNALTAMLPQSSCLKLGRATCDEHGVRKAVKKTAPIARGCWRMYLTQAGAELEYGLFRDSGHPLNVPLDLILQGGAAGDAKFIRVTKLAESVVKIATHTGEYKVVHFTNAMDGVANTETLLSELSSLICSRLKNRVASSCTTYLGALLSRAVRQSHGALIAVKGGRTVPSWLGDCTELDTPLDICAAVEAVLADAKAIPDLEALEKLICGMLSCDGIVVFDTKARVLAYNAFIKLKATNVDGGARKRAYKALCGKVGKDLVAVYFQSQDGASELERNNNE